MAVSEQTLEWLSIYGLPVYFFILAASSFGIPMPVKLTMLVFGSFVQQGEIAFWQAMVIGSTGAVIGDQAGYFLGRLGGRNAADRITNRFGGAEKIKRAEEFSRRWGGTGIFFSRWLVTPFGPWLNLTSGLTFYSWTRFTVFGILGETLWVFLYIMLGIYFSDRVQDTADLLSNLTWVFVGITIAAVLGWKLFRNHGNDSETKSSTPSRQ